MTALRVLVHPQAIAVRNRARLRDRDDCSVLASAASSPHQSRKLPEPQVYVCRGGGGVCGGGLFLRFKENQGGCDFEDDVFHARVVHVLDNHTNASASANATNPAQPLFLYWASHACHGPRQVPAATYAKFAFIPDPQRRMHVGLLPLPPAPSPSHAHTHTHTHTHTSLDRTEVVVGSFSVGCA